MCCLYSFPFLRSNAFSLRFSPPAAKETSWVFRRIDLKGTVQQDIQGYCGGGEGGKEGKDRLRDEGTEKGRGDVEGWRWAKKCRF